MDSYHVIVLYHNLLNLSKPQVPFHSIVCIKGIALVSASESRFVPLIWSILSIPIP